MKYLFERTEDQGKTFVYSVDTNDETKANLCRMTMMNGIKTWRIKYVTYDINESLFTEEHISMRCGLSPIKQNELKEILESRRNSPDYDPKKPDEIFKFYFDIDSKDREGWVTTDHIKGIPFFMTHKISYVQKNSRLRGYVEVREGYGIEWSSHMCTTIPTIHKVDDYFEIKFGTLGMYDHEFIMKESIRLMKDEFNASYNNIYDKPIFSKACIEEFSN